jgi:carbon-monoxide dehydrogenase medium subunit
VKPAQFEYHRPETVGEALELVDAHPHDGEVMAGNQSLGIMLANRLATPDHVVDINGLDELSYVSVDGDRVEVGAMARHRDIERSDALRERAPLFPEAAEQIAGPSVRNRGTFGGSIGEADPAGNYPCALVALDGHLTLRSVDGERTVDAADYVLGFMFTDLAENELIVSGGVDLGAFPTDRSGMAFVELKRAAQTWPTVSAAGAVRVDDPTAGAPTVEAARIALANAGDVPLRVPEAEAAVEGSTLGDDALAAAGGAVREAADPDGELHADAEFKEEAATEYARRAFRTAYDRATR